MEFGVWGLEVWAQGSGFGVRGLEFGVWGLGVKASDLGIGHSKLVIRDQQESRESFGYRRQGSKIRAWKSGHRV